MAQDKFNLKKVLADNSQVSDLANLASSGVKRVKVLDENTLQELIQRGRRKVNAAGWQDRIRVGNCARRR